MAASFQTVNVASKRVRMLTPLGYRAADRTGRLPQTSYRGEGVGASSRIGIAVVNTPFIAPRTHLLSRRQIRCDRSSNPRPQTLRKPAVWCLLGGPAVYKYSITRPGRQSFVLRLWSTTFRPRHRRDDIAPDSNVASKRNSSSCASSRSRREPSGSNPLSSRGAPRTADQSG